MRKLITLFAAAYITLFSVTTANAQSFGDPQFCNLLAAVAEEVQLSRQAGYAPQQIANRHAQFLSEAFSGRGDGAMRQRAANEMAQITKAIIEDAFIYPIQPTYELKRMAASLYKIQVFDTCTKF